jgi:fatty acid desaturase
MRFTTARRETWIAAAQGDIWTLTVQEYLQSSLWKRFAYRLARNPIVLFAIAPLYVFVIHHRFAVSTAPRRERQSVRHTNWMLLGVTALMSVTIGLKQFLLIQCTVSALAGAAGLWLFYVQHQFQGAYWARTDKWNYTDAALKGSSFYKLPRMLQWFTGNIGFHHIHHLSPRIPNYHLQQCHEADPVLQVNQAGHVHGQSDIGQVSSVGRTAQRLCRVSLPTLKTFNCVRAAISGQSAALRGEVAQLVRARHS